MSIENVCPTIELLARIFNYVSTSEKIAILQHFLYDWKEEELNELSFFLSGMLISNEYACTEQEEELFFQIIRIIVKHKNPLVNNLDIDEQENIYMSEIKYLATACSLAKLARMGLIRFDNVHLSEYEWKVMEA